MMMGVFSCEKEDHEHDHDHSFYGSHELIEHEFEHFDASEYVQGTQNKEAVRSAVETAESLGYEKFNLSANNAIYYQVSPNGGQCGTTEYLFLVKDYGEWEDMQVKLYLPNNVTVYQDMYRWGDYQYVFLKSHICGDIFWRYVLKQNQQTLIPTQKLKNTGVDIRVNGTSKIGWTFGDDGSSWSNKAGWWQIFGSAFHTGLDLHAQDWNWGSGNQDLGKVMRAPLCGKVVSAGWAGNCYGNVVDIEHYSGTNIVMYRVAHMDQVDVQTGDLISRNTKIGTLGKSGSSTCSGGGWTAHAHSVLYRLDANFNIVAPLEFEYSY